MTATTGNGQSAEDDPRWIYPKAAPLMSDAGVLAQILADVRTVAAQMTEMMTRIAVLESLMRDTTNDHADHEARIREIERTAPTRATTANLAQLDSRVDTMLPRLDYEQDRANRTRRLLWSLGIGIPAFIAVVIPVESIILSRLYG